MKNNKNKKDLVPLLDHANYKWEPTTKFPLDGVEFTILFNNLSNLVNTKEFQDKLNEARQTTALFQLFELAQKKLQEAVTEGEAILVPDQNMIEQQKKMSTPTGAVAEEAVIQN